jgi:hypothetical protein
VTGNLRLTSTASPDMQPIVGTLRINLATGELVVDVAQLDFYRRVTLAAAQRTSVQNIIGTAQNSLESGLVSLGVVAGTQSAGV